MTKLKELENYLTDEVMENTHINPTRIFYEYFLSLGQNERMAANNAYLESIKKGADIEMIPEMASQLIRRLIKPRCPICEQEMGMLSSNTANDSTWAGYYCTACLVSFDISISNLKITFVNSEEEL